MKSESGVHVDKINKKNKWQIEKKKLQARNNKFQVKLINDCTRCGLTHRMNEYPAHNQTCYKCNKKNLFSKKCQARNIREIEQESKQVEDDEIFIAVMDKEENNLTNEDWTEVIELKNQVFMKFKLDTGAQANIISKFMFDKIPNVDISELN